MRQLFQNLLGNALKYRGEKTPVIRVYAEPGEREGFHEIRVEDNGIGFDQCLPRQNLQTLPEAPYEERTLRRHRYGPRYLQKNSRAPRREHHGTEQNSERSSIHGEAAGETVMTGNRRLGGHRGPVVLTAGDDEGLPLPPRLAGGWAGCRE